MKMGVELLEIGVKVRKGVIFTTRGCFRTVRNHPFLVGMLCFLIILYRSSPFIFQLLVSASPILVCTAILLGTLLSFGQPNIPEIEIEEKTTIEAVLNRSGVLGDATVVEENESHFVERFSEQPELSAGKLSEIRREEDSDDTAPLIEERSRGSDASDSEERGKRELGELRYKEKDEWIEERRNNGDAKLGEVRREEDSYDTAPLIEERPRGSEVSDKEEREGKRELSELRYKQKGDWIEERLNNGDAKVNGEVVDSDDEKSEADSFDSEKVNVDSLDSPPLSPWARVEEREEEEEKESEKEQDEDEEGSDSESDCAESSSPDASMADIMPMLDELHPLLDEESDPHTVRLSRGSSEKSLKSSASSRHSDDESESHEHLEAADDENEDGEDEEEDTHGEKDEETKSAITWTEQDQKNLMDLGSSEIERNQRLENLILRRRARKSTNLFAERNLIDLESSDLPFNIAPISTRRQNPFDLPQDSYDDLGLPPIPGSAPSVMLQRRNPFDIPYDSSEEKPDLKGDVFQEEFTSSQPREPVFRRHESFNVGPSMFAPSRRQDVKMRPYFVPERTISEESSSSLFQRQSSGLSDSKASSIPETESVTSVEDTEEKKLPDTDSLSEREIVELPREVAEEGPSGDPEVISQHEVDTEEMISKMEGVSEHIGHRSQSSEDEDCLELDHIEKRDHQVGESQLEDVADRYEQGSTSQYVEAQGFGNGSTSEAVESRYSRDSSSSSLSEVSERVFIDTEGEGLLIVEEPSISTQTSLGSADQNITSALAIDITQRAPIYDSSPRGLSKNAASSSISCDVLAESSVGEKSEESRREIETDIPRNVEVFPDSSISHSAADVDIREHYNVNTDFAPHMFIPSRSHGEASMDEHLMEKHVLDEASVSVDDKNVHGLTEASGTQLEGLPRTGSSNSVDETVEPPDSDAEIRHETDEKLISVLPSEGNTSLFYETAIQEPDFNYLNQVQASSTPVESFVDDQITHDLDMPEVQELDRYINSPSSPKFISVLPSAIETSSSRFDVQTVIEEVDEIKEIDEGLLSELDNVGDFSIGQLDSGKSEFEKHVGSVGEESSSSIYHAETSSTRAAEVHSVEVNKVETFPLSEESREHMDVHEQDTECISEIPTYQTDRAESIEVSKFDENDHDSPHQEASDEETHTITNQNNEDALSGIPEMKTQPIENVSVLATKAELASVETEVVVAEVPCHGQVDTDTTSGMPEIEASSIEDIDLAFKQTSSKEIEKHIVLDPPQAELQNHEDTISAIPESEVVSEDHTHAAPEKAEPTSVETEIRVGVAEVSSSEMTELEASTIEDLDLAFKQISSEAKEDPLLLKPIDADTPSQVPELEATKVEDTDLVSKKTRSMEIEKHVVLEDTDCETPEQEAQLAEDAHAVSKHTELTFVETEVVMAGANMSSQDEIRAEATSEITEIEASSVEEIDLAFEQIISKATEKPVDLEPVDTDSTSGMPEIEASSVEAINQAFKNIASEEIKNRDFLDPLHRELVVGENITENSGDTSLHVSTNEASVLGVGPSNDAELNDKQTTESIAAVVDSTLPVVEFKETQGAFSEMHVAEAVPSEATALPPPNQVSDDETREHLKLKSDEESAKVKANDKVGTSAEKPNHEDEAVEDLHSPSSRKGKGKKLSRSSSSSSSSSSHSSSSDSDKD